MTEMTVSADLIVEPAPGTVAIAAGAAAGAAGRSELATTEACDSRLARLMGPAWWQLADVVRARFSVPLADGSSRTFAGCVTKTELSRAGRLFAAATRLIAGGLLPTTHGATGPAVVIVTEDSALGGQIWTRCYARPGAFPETISSVKRFAGPTGLEEYLGLGLVMRLTLHAEDGALVFRSAGYDLCLGRLRLPLGPWLSPGRCTVTHRPLGPTRFSFTLALDHPWLGRLVHQIAEFEVLKC